MVSRITTYANSSICHILGWLVWFYGISIIAGYLMLNLVDLWTYVNKVKWFQVLLCIDNNSIRHQSFVYIPLNDQTVLFPIIQFTISHLFAFTWNVK